MYATKNVGQCNPPECLMKLTVSIEVLSEEARSVLYVQHLTEEDGPCQAPIDLNIKQTRALSLPLLSWYNYDVYPKKMKITNTGHTVIVSGKWGRQRPFVRNGPLMGSGYVFSQLHFHWGSNDSEGSEHTVEGVRYPMEMHVVHFKSCYLTQESALKEKDGIVILVYLFKWQQTDNPDIEILSEALPYIRYPQTSARVDPLPMSFVVRPFDSDYLLYWGSITTECCTHLALWLASRQPIGVSSNQLALFRSISGINHQKLLRNFREAKLLNNNHNVFHILPSSSLSNTLLPVAKRGMSDTGDRNTSQCAPTPNPYHDGHAHHEKYHSLLNHKPLEHTGLCNQCIAVNVKEMHQPHSCYAVSHT